ncbi:MULTISPECIES: tRNA1(Val) (adenine(37)-N6)-methyltransferase [unclassified Planococcus (in: firmicutes)]|uniref:tRNA1(Val) (adenine(37)-N6)-methyltransferase n=1 Tax=Planococcus TaxID=1372 RepID=UPI000C32067E|nr:MULTISPECIES: tRNA1(Val) (adenine(37)-N6)-methyltransferase [unclassified Planococcus (in: firmicutes)]AUD12541.1 SAM-dependent methyltransferase [Planococcus sp. MB-3u-03]PKG44440.1 SAM-dependent methyltransferase [Planococcus sp. Urea-trap-24]PKG91253.1 SAM-dependent methyltransferase [Planococcus sp. Urea-3u-39]PKH39592.1 SAM-dependent methyltransferase [Planococcus sp. MB-3u-09]
MLTDDERLDYLLAENLRIIQSPSVFSFSLDAVLLARFAYVPKKRGRIVDLCTGNGAIPLFLSARTESSITGVELQPRLAGMARRSIEFNGLDGQIDIIEGDVKEIPAQLGYEKFDTVTCNPPYFPAHDMSDKNLSEHMAIARHELHLTLDEAVRSASQLLKQGGKAAFVHRAGRLIDIMAAMRNNRLEPKRIRLVYPKAGKEANTLLIEGIKDGKPDLKVLPPLIVYGEDGKYTEEVRGLLYGTEQ